jgi:hypothetical protein
MHVSVDEVVIKDLEDRVRQGSAVEGKKGEDRRVRQRSRRGQRSGERSEGREREERHASKKKE